MPFLCINFHTAHMRSTLQPHHLSFRQLCLISYNFSDISFPVFHISFVEFLLKSPHCAERHRHKQRQYERDVSPFGGKKETFPYQRVYVCASVFVSASLSPRAAWRCMKRGPQVHQTSGSAGQDHSERADLIFGSDRPHKSAFVLHYCYRA